MEAATSGMSPSGHILHAGDLEIRPDEFTALVKRRAAGAHGPRARAAHGAGRAPGSDSLAGRALRGRLGGAVPKGRPLRRRLRRQAATEAGRCPAGGALHPHPLRVRLSLHTFFTRRAQVDNRLRLTAVESQRRHERRTNKERVHAKAPRVRRLRCLGARRRGLWRRRRIQQRRWRGRRRRPLGQDPHRRLKHRGPVRPGGCRRVSGPRTPT